MLFWLLLSVAPLVWPPLSEGPSDSASVTLATSPQRIEADVLFPSQTGPRPALVYNHGSERTPSMKYLGRTARWFQERGYVVVVPYRRGTVASGGRHWSEGLEDLGPGERANAMVTALEQEAEDVVTAVQWLESHSRVDPGRVIVAGCSFGGVVSLLARERLPGLHATLGFATAAHMWSRNPVLRARLEDSAVAATTPVMLLQAANDADVTPTRVLGAALKNAGIRHDAQVFPAYGQTTASGHAGFCNRAQDVWGPRVMAFLDADGGRDR